MSASPGKAAVVGPELDFLSNVTFRAIEPGIRP